MRYSTVFLRTQALLFTHGETYRGRRVYAIIAGGCAELCKRPVLALARTGGVQLYRGKCGSIPLQRATARLVLSGLTSFATFPPPCATPVCNRAGTLNPASVSPAVRICMPTEPQLSVILTTYHRPAHLERCLHCLTLQQGMDGKFEVIVADDGSQDNTEQVVRSVARTAAFPVKWVTHPHRGFRAALCRNDGVRASSAPYLVFVDCDCLFPRDHLQNIFSHAGAASFARVIACDWIKPQRSELTRRRLKPRNIAIGFRARNANASCSRKSRIITIS